MTTTNVYQGLATDKSTSRVLHAPGGGSSNIFGHYQDESNREEVEKRQRETEAVVQSINKGADADGNAHHNFMDNKDSFAANRQRNQGDGAPFATSDSMVSSGRTEAFHAAPPPGADMRTAKQMQEANRSRNQGSGAPFATGDSLEVTQQADRAAHNQQTVGSDYQTPQQRQASNPNKATNSFSNLFGDTDAGSSLGAKAKGKISTHNPVTWEAYSNFDAVNDHPQHRSRYENYASTKAGTFNPITGEDHVGGPNSATSTKVQAPPGGKSSIQF